jgi:sec-independent protein translocase protein TatC
VTEQDWSSFDIDNLLNAIPAVDAFTITRPLPYAVVLPEKEKQETAASGGDGKGSGSGGNSHNEDELDSTEMPFLDHLEEFRWALLKSIFALAIGVVAAWFIAGQFLSTITRLAKAAELPLVYTKLMEPIIIQLQVSVYLGLVLALPFVFYFMWSFVAPGLYRREKKWILPVVYTATVSFLIGAAIAYFLMIPLMLKFMKAFMVDNVNPMLTIGDFISKILMFTIVFGVTFELPLISYILAKIGIIKHTWMSKYRRYAIVVIFIVAAIFTPPDPISQIMMAIPLLFLYEISIFVARIAGKKTLI